MRTESLPAPPLRSPLTLLGSRTQRALVHAAILLAPSFLLIRPSLAAVLAVGAWAGATALEADDGAGDADIPVFEKLRALGLLATLWLATCTVVGSAPAVAFGVSAIAFGSVLRQWAIHSLGSGFRAGLAPSVPLTTDGPYRWLRHPSELGLVLMMGGVVLMTGSLPGICAWALLVALPSMRRIQLEERILAPLRA